MLDIENKARDPLGPPSRHAGAGYCDYAVFQHEYDTLTDAQKQDFVQLLNCPTRICLTG